MGDDWSDALRSSVFPSLEMACVKSKHRFVRTRNLPKLTPIPPANLHTLEHKMQRTLPRYL